MAEYPRPRSWDEFEEICWDLFVRLWNDPDTVRHGRSGQAQSGVDLYGRLDGQGLTVGAQCKLHQEGKVLTWDEVEAEVEKAEQFKPPLAQYTIATTAPRDAFVQQKVRELTEAHSAKGLFPVNILFWEDICSRLANYPAVVQKHYPSFFYRDDAATGPSAALGPSDYLLPPEQLAKRLAPFFEGGKHTAIRRFIRDAVARFWQQLSEPDLTSPEAFKAWKAEQESWKADRLIILDALLTTALEAIEYDAHEFVAVVHESFYRIYERANVINPTKLGSLPIDRSLVWGEIIKRVYILGSSLVELGKFESAAKLIDQKITWDEHRGSRLWARHAIANMKALGKDNLVSMTLDEIDREPWFLRAFVDRERALDRLCQFDFLQAIHAVHLANNTRAVYPSFGFYYNHRTEPIVSLLISDQAVRSIAIPPMNDARLAELISALDQVAGQVAFLGSWDQESWSTPQIHKFLAQNAT